MIESYFEELEKTIHYFERIIKSYSVSKKVYNSKLGYISGSIFFLDDSQLRFIEVKNSEHLHKIKYRFQYMDIENNLIFRYDNAGHHREISTYPHHKHSRNEVQECAEPTLKDVLVEIRLLVQGKS